MIKIKKILLCTILFLNILVFKAYAGYVYENEISLFRLNRNIVKPTYNKIYDKDSWTNQDVIITISADKVLEIMDGDFKLSDDGKTLTKTVTENESGIIKIRDEDYNYDQIEYEVSWIDKEKPKIIGAENNVVYNNDIHLQYIDNGEIEEIFVDKYDKNFEVYTNDTFVDLGSRFFIPFNNNSITALVKSHPKGVEKYNYYLNNVLYATTSEKTYTFQNLDELTYNIKIKVEGIDRNGNVLANKEYTIKTGVFNNLEIEKTETTGQVKFLGISNKIKKMVCYTWVDGQYSSTLKYGDVKIENNEAVCSFDIKNFKNYKRNYIMNFYFYYDTEQGEKCFIYGGNFDLSNVSQIAEEDNSINDFLSNGNYYVRVTDKADNESELDFSIQK